MEQKNETPLLSWRGQLFYEEDPRVNTIWRSIITAASIPVALFMGWLIGLLVFTR